MDREASAFPVLFTMLCGIAVADLSMQVLTATTLILSDVSTYSLFAKITAPVSVCMFILSVMSFRLIVKKGRAESKEQETLTEIDAKIYHHPLETFDN